MEKIHSSLNTVQPGIYVYLNQCVLNELIHKSHHSPSQNLHQFPVYNKSYKLNYLNTYWDQAGNVSKGVCKTTGSGED